MKPKDLADRCHQLCERIDQDPAEADVSRDWDELWRETLAAGDDVSFADFVFIASTGWGLAILLGHYHQAAELINPIVSDTRFSTLGALSRLDAPCDLALVEFMCGNLDAAADIFLHALSGLPEVTGLLTLQGSFVLCQAYSSRQPGRQALSVELMELIVSDTRFEKLDARLRIFVRCNQAYVLFLSGQTELAIGLYSELVILSSGDAERLLIRDSVGLCVANSMQSHVGQARLLRTLSRLNRKIERILETSNAERNVAVRAIRELLEKIAKG